MYEQIEIFVIGDNNEKGRALEQQFGYILNHLGYTDLSYDILRTGEEIDIKGKSKLFDEPLIAECKARKEARPVKEIKIFYASFQADLDKDPKMHGIFISLSGFKSNALEWYDENISEDKKKIFKLLVGKDFIDILNKENLLCSLDLLESKVQSITSIPISKKQLILTGRGIFWKITTYSELSDSLYVFFLEAKGESARKIDIQYLLERISLKNETLLQIKDRHLLISAFFDLVPKNVNKLSELLQESVNDIQIILDELFEEKVIEKKDSEIKIIEEFHAFYLVYKEAKSHGINDLVSFMLSNYYDKIVEDMIEPIIGRYKFRMSEDKKKILIKILKISPKCLEFCLEGDTTPFKNSYNQMIEGKTVTKEVEDRFNENQSKYFFQIIIANLFADCFEHPPITKDLELKENIKTIFSRLNMKFGSETELLLELYAEIPILMMSLASGHSIGWGEYVAVQKVDTFINIGNRFFVISEFEKAIDQYDEIIKNFQKDKAKGLESLSFVKAKLNKASALKNLERNKEALIELEDIKNTPLLKDNKKLSEIFSKIVNELRKN